MIGNARVSHGTQKDRVEWPQLLDTIGRHHLPSLDIIVATPIKLVPVEAESEALPSRFQHTDAFRNHFFPDAVTCDDCNFESFHGCQTYPFLADSKGESALTSEAESKVLTEAMIFSVLTFGQSAYSAHPRNFEAASSKLIGFAGLPLAKSARPVLTLPSFKWIFRIDVILSKPALSAWGST